MHSYPYYLSSLYISNVSLCYRNIHVVGILTTADLLLSRQKEKEEYRIRSKEKAPSPSQRNNGMGNTCFGNAIIIIRSCHILGGDLGSSVGILRDE